MRPRGRLPSIRASRQQRGSLGGDRRNRPRHRHRVAPRRDGDAVVARAGDDRRWARRDDRASAPRGTRPLQPVRHSSRCPGRSSGGRAACAARGGDHEATVTPRRVGRGITASCRRSLRVARHRPEASAQGQLREVDRYAGRLGEVSERPKERDWKSRTWWKLRRGFKSRPLRRTWGNPWFPHVPPPYGGRPCDPYLPSRPAKPASGRDGKRIDARPTLLRALVVGKNPPRHFHAQPLEVGLPKRPASGTW